MSYTVMSGNTMVMCTTLDEALALIKKLEKEGRL